MFIYIIKKNQKKIGGSIYDTVSNNYLFSCVGLV